MANYVGLDLGATQARILEAEGSAKKLKVVRFETVDLAPEAAAKEGPAARMLDKEAAGAIDKALAKGKFKREPVAMSWESGQTVFRELDLPFTGTEQIRKVIKFEAESHLLNCDIDDVVVSYYKLAEEKEKSHLMVMAVRKDQLLNRFDVLGRAGIDPLLVDLDVMAAFNALSALGYTKEHKSFLLLDCGHASTNLLLIANGRLVSGRAIRMGSQGITRRLAQDLGEDGDAAESGERARKLLEGARGSEHDLLVPVAARRREDSDDAGKAPAELARDLAVQRADDFHVKLAREVRRTLATSRMQDPIEVVYVTGPGSQLAGFAEGVQERLNLEAPVKRLALFERVDHALDQTQAPAAEAEMLTALGLAFKMAGHDDTGVDFRQEECRYTRKFDQVKEPLLYVCFFVLFLVLLVNLLDAKILWVKEPFFVKEEQSDLARIQKYAREEFIKALGSEAELPAEFQKPSLRSLDRMKLEMTKKKQQLMDELGRGGTIQPLKSALPLWRDCFDQIQARSDRIGRFMLDDLTISVHEREPFIKMDAVLESLAAHDNLIQALNAIPDVVEVKQGKAESIGDYVKISGIHVTFPKPEEYR